MLRFAGVPGALVLLTGVAVAASAPGTAPYDPSLDGWTQLRAAGQKAVAENRRVLVIVDGNWCKWCRALNRLMAGDAALKAELGRYEVVHLNYSKENKNPAAMAHLGNPDKLGFPSLLVLSPQLKVLHTQSTEVFETGDPAKPGHDPTKLLAFLARWHGTE